METLVRYGGILFFGWLGILIWHHAVKPALRQLGGEIWEAMTDTDEPIMVFFSVVVVAIGIFMGVAFIMAGGGYRG